MSELDKMKYKDKNPIDTINKVRSILGELGVLTREENWKNSTRGFYSVTVRIVGTDIYSNGKGSNSKYALASAYGELMERIQNMTYFRFSYDMSEEDLGYQGFYYSPDEKDFSVKEIVKNNDWVNFYKNMNSDDFNEVLKQWKQVSYENVKNDFVAIPYKEFNSGNVSYIPVKMVCKIYMSNGMCAGNTKEEALVQGICEIFERKVNKEVVLNKLTPPDIPRDYLKKFKSIYNKISLIEASGKYKVIVKDCSLGMNYPVVSVLLVDCNKGKYFVKFGAHPVFKVALDRTLNELLQGQEINNMIGLSEFSYINKIKSIKGNMVGILENGIGYYPMEFFDKNYSYKFNGIKKVTFNTNKEILDYLVKLIEKQGFKIFVRDVSFLGFPSYHVVIPGLSDIDDFYDVESIINYGEYNKLKKLIRKANKLTTDEIELLLVYLNGYKFDIGAGIVSVLNIPVNSSFPLYYTNSSLYKACLYYEIKEYGKAAEEVENFLSDIELMGMDREKYPFFRCLRDCLFMKKDKINSLEIKVRLKMFYFSSLVDDIMKIIKEENSLFSYFGSINCFNCEKCFFKNNCKYTRTASLYKTLKNRMWINFCNK